MSPTVIPVEKVSSLQARATPHAPASLGGRAVPGKHAPAVPDLFDTTTGSFWLPSFGIDGMSYLTYSCAGDVRR
jgi:hypothetical protein